MVKIPHSQFFLFIFLLIGTVAFSQEEVDFDPNLIDITDKLPPLEELIDSAYEHNPGLSILEQQVIITGTKLNSEKWGWTRNISFSGSAGYGNMYNYSTSSDGSLEPIPIASVRYQNQYTASVRASLPLNTITDRKNQLRIARIGVIQSELDTEVKKQEIRQNVIQQYYNLISNQKLVQLKVKNFESIKLKIQLAEQEFRNGLIPLSEYTNVLNAFNESESALEKAKSDLLIACLLFEDLVGIKLNFF